MKTSYLFLCAAALLSVSACGTINGAGMDFQNWGNYLDRNFGDDRNANENSEQAPFQEAPQSQINSEPLSLQASTDCPNIILKPLMSSLVDFQDPAAPSDATMIAKANLTNARSNCRKGVEFVTVSLDLSFNAVLGPKAKQNPNDKPYLSFPYFISVTDYQGNELAREVFSASFSFNENENQRSTAETIEQSLPLNADGSLSNYYMEIGFQLTDEQMAYNNANRSYF